MANECSVLNPECIAKKGTPCPAYNAGKNCWEYDWMPLFNQMKTEDQQQWKQFMAEKCPQCTAFREPMKKMIARIQES